MHLHMPHFNPQQRALLRNLLGAAVSILTALVLVGLMALLLVFPDKAFGFKVIAPPQNKMVVVEPAMLQRAATALSNVIPPYLRKLSEHKAE